MKPLRLALVRQRYTPFGGAERFVASAVQALGKEGTSVTMITRRWETVEEEEHLICNPPYLGSLWRDWSFARCVCRELKNQYFDLVQSHERIACCDVYRAGDGVHREWLAQRRRVLTPLGQLSVTFNPYHRYMLEAEKKLFTSPSLKAVICISHMVKEDIQRHYPIPEDKLHVIYNGVDTTRFHPSLAAEYRHTIRESFDIPAEAPLFLFVGSGFQRKGLAIALGALARLPATACLLVVGKDKHAERFVRHAARLGIAERVRFVGGQKDVRPFYGAADALVFPTLYEPFGNVALEAMASGLPVLTSTKSGAAELIQNGINGFVRDALDEAGFAEGMAEILKREHRPAMTAAARQTVEGMTLEAMAGELTAFYGQILESRDR